MNLKHIKVALKCIPIYKLLLCHFRLPPLLFSAMYCFGNMWMYRAQCRHVCSGSVMPFDLIAVNMTLVKRRNFLHLPSFAQWKRPGVSLHVASSLASVVATVFTAGGRFGPALHVFKKMALCCAACFIR